MISAEIGVREKTSVTICSQELILGVLHPPQMQMLSSSGYKDKGSPGIASTPAAPGFNG